MTKSVFVPINNGVVILDYDDYLDLKGKIYGSSSSGYARTTHVNGKETVLVHRHIMGYPKEIVDHINQNKLDNRRKNLRLSTKSLNGINTSPRTGRYKGVCLDVRSGKFRAYVTMNLKRHEFGSYESEVEAAEIVNLFIIKNLGYGYRLNNIGNDYSFFTPIPTRYYPKFKEVSHITKKRNGYLVRFEVDTKKYLSKRYDNISEAIIYRNNIYCILYFLHCRCI